jgi:molybdopterin converting factor small subunit
MIKEIHLFGLLKEQYGDMVSVEVPAYPITVEEVVKAFRKNYSEVNDIPFLIAVNHFMASDKDEVNENDHLALLPPVSGG